MTAVRCASVLKPLYAWVAGPSHRDEAEHAIVYSDNTATDALIYAAGGLSSVLDDITSRTGVRWNPAPTWGQVPITGVSLTVAYSAFGFARDPWTRHIRTLMTQVVPTQRFGIAEGVPMKAGWDLDEHAGELLTHAVVLTAHRAHAVVTHTPISARLQRTWRARLAAGGPEAVIPIHERHVIDAFHELTVRSFEPGLPAAA